MHRVSAESSAPSGASVFSGVTPYHWVVVVIASCGWLFDCMDQRLFVLARESALRDLLGPQFNGSLTTYAGYATTAMILGWATGGIIFGVASDRIGRVKTMVMTLVVYSAGTGLGGAAHGWLDFTLYRFLAGIGIGGMFGAATALVAESVPGHFRAVALGSLQALSATGNIIGSLITLRIPPGSQAVIGNYPGWRLLFFVGVLPAILVIPMIRLLREPDSWIRARHQALANQGADVGSLSELFRDRRWRRNTLVGLFLGISGMIGLWGIGFFSPELISTALHGANQVVIDRVRSWGTALQDAGSFAGMLTFTLAAAYVSRRAAFCGALALSLISTIFVFQSLTSATDAYWMLPLMGFAQLAVFAGYSIYFPELFPTRLRGTGVGFCYNTVRYLAAPAPILFGYLALRMSFRSAATAMSLVYLVGLAALLWAPETKGQPLPAE